MLERLLKTDSVRSVSVWVDMPNIFGSRLLVIPHKPGTTRRSFREVANAAARVFVVNDLRIVFVVLVLDRTLAIRIARLKTPLSFLAVYLLTRLGTMDEGATGQTVVILAHVQEMRVVVRPLLTAPTPSVTPTFFQAPYRPHIEPSTTNLYAALPHS